MLALGNSGESKDPVGASLGRSSHMPQARGIEGALHQEMTAQLMAIPRALTRQGPKAAIVSGLRGRELC